MASNRTRPHELSWPLDAQQVAHMDDMFQHLFSKYPLLPERGGTGFGTGDVGIGALIYGDEDASGDFIFSALDAVSAGSYLRSDGLLTAPLWSTVKIPNTSAAGDIWYANTLDTVQGLTVGASGTLIRSNGTIPAYTAFTIPNTFAQGDLLYASASNVLTALVKDATATRYLSNKGASNAPQWSQVTLTNGVTGTLPVGNGGTALTAISQGGLLVGNGGIFSDLALSATVGVYLRGGGTGSIPFWSTLVLPNAASQGDTFIATATNVMTVLAKNTTATRYLSNTGTNNNPAWAQVDLTNGVTGDLPFANLAQGSALSVLGVTGNATADNASIAAGSDHQVLRRSGTAVAFGAVNIAQSAAVIGALAIANGGTGQTTAGPAQGALNAEFTTTSTGNIDDLDFSNASLVRMNNATDATIRGLLAGTAGQRVTIQSVGAGHVYLSHQNTGDATAANRLINFLTSADTPLAAGVGSATFEYDGTTSRWRLIAHHQGAAIAFSTTWAGSVTNPAIGNGTLAALYHVVDRMVHFSVSMTAGTTTTFGTGFWTFSVPIALGGSDLPGVARAVDTGVLNYPGIVTFASATTLNMLDDVTGVQWSVSTPFAWGSTDVGIVSIWYQS